MWGGGGGGNLKSSRKSNTFFDFFRGWKICIRGKVSRITCKRTVASKGKFPNRFVRPTLIPDKSPAICPSGGHKSRRTKWDYRSFGRITYLRH